MREIVHNWISPVRIKVNASRIAAATASAAQSEDRSANQKPHFSTASVKRRKPHSEHKFSRLSPKADLRQRR
jgi:hypothetical protein